MKGRNARCSEWDERKMRVNVNERRKEGQTGLRSLVAHIHLQISFDPRVFEVPLSGCKGTGRFLERLLLHLELRLLFPNYLSESSSELRDLFLVESFPNLEFCRAVADGTFCFIQALGGRSRHLEGTFCRPHLSLDLKEFSPSFSKLVETAM